MAGKKKKKFLHIYEIYVECIWRTSPEMHVISEYWRRRKRLGRWRGSINWGHELRSIRFYLPVVLEKCFVIRWLDVGGVLGVQYQIKETGTNSKFTFLSQLCLFHKQFKIDNVLYIQWANLWTDIWVQQELKCDGMSNAKKNEEGVHLIYWT